MDQIRLIQVYECQQQNGVILKFFINDSEVFERLEYQMCGNDSEQFSQSIYEHLEKRTPDDYCFIYFVEPLECIQKQRWEFTSQMCSDIILKLLNLQYIPIIRTNYSKYNFEPIKQEQKSIIDKMNINLQSICQNKSIINKDFITTLNEFKHYYGIELLMSETLKPIKQEINQEFDLLYVPTDELIFRKTNKKISLSMVFETLEKIIKRNKLL